MSKDKQRAVIEFLRLEGETGDNIHSRLVKVYGDEAYSRSAVFEWVREVDNGRTDLKDLPRSGRARDLQISSQITTLLQEFPFHSTRSLADEVGVCNQTIANYLERMGYSFRVLKWVPYPLNSDNKKKRLQMCKTMIETLKTQQRLDWKYIVTGDQSWFYLEYMPNGMWCLSGSSPAISVRHTIQSQKYMITIFWNPHGFHVVEMLPDGEKFTAEYMTSVILAKLVEALYGTVRPKNQRKIWVHIDNAAPHNAKLTRDFLEKSEFHRLPQPPYSPDISPSDFYLFGTVKDRLIGLEDPSPIDLFTNILAVLDDISPLELKSVFDRWIDRVQAVIYANGNYF
jgi:histone-lysine N-methyltransferase SETMAR